MWWAKVVLHVGDLAFTRLTVVMTGRRRRVYQLTDEGRSARVAHRRSWRDYAAAVDPLLGDGTVAATT